MADLAVEETMGAMRKAALLKATEREERVREALIREREVRDSEVLQQAKGGHKRDEIAALKASADKAARDIELARERRRARAAVTGNIQEIPKFAEIPKVAGGDKNKFAEIPKFGGGDKNSGGIQEIPKFAAGAKNSGDRDNEEEIIKAFRPKTPAKDDRRGANIDRHTRAHTNIHTRIHTYAYTHTYTHTHTCSLTHATYDTGSGRRNDCARASRRGTSRRRRREGEHPSSLPPRRPRTQSRSGRK
jgi:hypothetical protein